MVYICAVFERKGIAMIYMDHAATTPLRDEALAAMLPYFKDQFCNASSSYAPARQARHAVEHARMQVAQAIGAARSEIYFTSGGSEADNWALFGAMRAYPQKKRIVTTPIEHHAVLNACAALEGMGCEIVYLAVDERGRVNVEDARRAITQETAIVSVMLANNEVGTIEPVAEIAKIARENGALMHTDAVQAVGHIPVNVNMLGADLLSMSAHKFGGPKGMGALYIRSGTRLKNLIFGGAQERGLRAGTENTPGIVGMGTAIEFSCAEMKQVGEQTSELRDELLQQIKALLPQVRINTFPENSLPGHLHLSIPDEDSASLIARLDMMGIAASAGSACASGSIERSHVLAAMRPADTGNWADLRLTLGKENTREDICAVIKALCDILHAT